MGDYEGPAFDESGNYLGEWGDVDAPINADTIPAYGDHGAGYIGEWPRPEVSSTGSGAEGCLATIVIAILGILAWLTIGGFVELFRGNILKGLVRLAIPVTLVSLILFWGYRNKQQYEAMIRYIEEQEAQHQQSIDKIYDELEQNFPVEITNAKRGYCNLVDRCDPVGSHTDEIYVTAKIKNLWREGRVVFSLAKNYKWRCEKMSSTRIEPRVTVTFLCQEIKGKPLDDVCWDFTLVPTSEELRYEDILEKTICVDVENTLEGNTSTLRDSAFVDVQMKKPTCVEPDVCSDDPIVYVDVRFDQGIKSEVEIDFSIKENPKEFLAETQQWTMIGGNIWPINLNPAESYTLANLYLNEDYTGNTLCITLRTVEKSDSTVKCRIIPSP